MNNLEIITKTLKKDKRLWSDDKEPQLLKAELISLVSQDDEKLIDFLVSENKIKDQFFKQIGKAIIFKKEKFLQLVTMNEFLPDSFTAFENKIGLQVNGSLLSKSDDVSLVFPHKDCILEGGQTKEETRRNEIFFNTILAPDEVDRLKEPKVFTNAVRIDKNGEKKTTEISQADNLVIKGNNLLVLYSLLPKYKNRVKLIYIDPPYNTETDTFTYNDSFSHSAWMVFMKNRLELAKELLSEDGFIFIQINDIEQAYLKILCDEIFGRDNFHTTITVQMSHLSGVKMAHKEVKLPKIKELILMYTKKKGSQMNPQFIPSTWDDSLSRYGSFVNKKNYSDEDCDKWEILTVNEAMKKQGIDVTNKSSVDSFKINNADLIFRTARNRGRDYSHLPKDNFSKISNPDGSYYFSYKHEDVAFAAEKVIELDGQKVPAVAMGDIWTDIGINNLSNEGSVDLRFGKKPEKLLERIMKLVTKEDDLVLDFFAGSGTTGAVAHKINRKYILVEQLTEHVEKLKKRLKEVVDGEQNGVSKNNNWKGGGNFVYLEMLEWNQKYIDLLKNAKTKKDVSSIKGKIEKESFYKYQTNFDHFDEKEFDHLSFENQKKVLCDVLDLNHLYVNLESIEDATFKVSDVDKKFNKMFYNKK